jgi:enoyl-[acyl-carrier protein] reductase II
MISMQAGAMGGIGGQTEGLEADKSCFAMGQSAGGVRDILSCKEIIDSIMAEAHEAISRVARLQASSPA